MGKEVRQSGTLCLCCLLLIDHEFSLFIKIVFLLKRNFMKFKEKTLYQGVLELAWNIK